MTNIFVHLQYWDSITREDLEFSVGIKQNQWDIKEPLMASASQPSANRPNMVGAHDALTDAETATISTDLSSTLRPSGLRPSAAPAQSTPVRLSMHNIPTLSPSAGAAGSTSSRPSSYAGTATAASLSAAALIGARDPPQERERERERERPRRERRQSGSASAQKRRGDDSSNDVPPRPPAHRSAPRATRGSRGRDVYGGGT